MLEHLPSWLGHALGSVRAGADRVASASLRPGECVAINLGSAAFGDGDRIPERARKKLYKQHKQLVEDYPDDWPVSALVL